MVQRAVSRVRWVNSAGTKQMSSHLGHGEAYDLRRNLAAGPFVEAGVKHKHQSDDQVGRVGPGISDDWSLTESESTVCL